MKTITAAIANYDDRRSLGARLRAKRIKPLLSMMDAVFKEHGNVEIVDVGGEKNYWNIVPYRYLEEYDVRITIVNLPSSSFSDEDDRFRFVAADGCDLSCFDDNSFHIAHSNSVIEHVGRWDRMVKFSKEIRRVAPRYFVQTPNYWFPIEPHWMFPFFHWLPQPIRIWLVLNFSLGHWTKATGVDAAVRQVEEANLLNKRMLAELFKDAQIYTERFLLLPKSLMAIKQ